jgi:hypothetical protein
MVLNRQQSKIYRINMLQPVQMQHKLNRKKTVLNKKLAAPVLQTLFDW